MKRFILRVALFLVPLLIVSLVLEYKIRTIDSIYKQKINGLIEQYNSIQILILGSSHAAEGIDPNQFELPAYNMAFASQTLYFDKRIVLKHLDQLENLKYVILSIDYQSLYYPHSPQRDIFYHYYYDIDYEDKYKLLEDLSYFYFGFAPKVALKQMSLDTEQLNNGWFSYDTTYYYSFEKEIVMNRVGHFNTIIQEHLENKDEILTDIDDLLAQLIDQEITPILITCPLHQSYRMALDSNIIIQNEIDITYLSRKHNIEHWSFLDEVFEDSEYLDNSHLNRSGAKKFALLLNDSLMAKLDMQ